MPGSWPLSWPISNGWTAFKFHSLKTQASNITGETMIFLQSQWVVAMSKSLLVFLHLLGIKYMPDLKWNTVNCYMYN